jgi:hypothetical protein
VKLPNKSLQATRDGRPSSAARLTSFGLARLSSACHMSINFIVEEISLRVVSLCLLLGCCLPSPGEAQGVIGAELPSEITNYDNSLAENFKAGRTNGIPLLRLYWFSDPDRPSPGYYRVHWFNLDASGQASSGVSSFSNGATWHTLSQTNLLSLRAAISQLPESSKEKLPYERQIIVSGVRSNEWFRAVYDRANIPKEIRAIFKQSEAHLEDYVH